jgi:hypothetical protein
MPLGAFFIARSPMLLCKSCLFLNPIAPPHAREYKRLELMGITKNFQRTQTLEGVSVMSKFTRKSAAAPVAAIFSALTRRVQAADDGQIVEMEDFEGDVLTHGFLPDEIEMGDDDLTEQFTVFSNPDGSITVLPRALVVRDEDPREKLVAVTGLEDDEMPLIRNNPFAVALLAPRC